MTTTAEQVRRIIAEQCGVPLEDVKPETQLIADLRLDSLDHIEVGMAMEDDLALVIEYEDAAKCVTVADYIALAERLTAPTGHA